MRKGHASPGKFLILDLLRTFLIHLEGKIHPWNISLWFVNYLTFLACVNMHHRVIDINCEENEYIAIHDISYIPSSNLLYCGYEVIMV